MIQVGAVPTPASLLGGVSGASDRLIDEINMELGSGSFFNSVDDLMSRGRQMFIDNVAKPARSIGNTIKDMIGLSSQEDNYVPITDADRLRQLPPVMRMSVLEYAPIKKLFDEGRVFGWGYEYVPEEDTYDRLINNGYVPDVLEAMDDDGYVEFKYHYKSDDPDLGFDELEAIERTRQYLDWVLENTDWDPTDPILDEELKFNSRG